MRLPGPTRALAAACLFAGMPAAAAVLTAPTALAQAPGAPLVLSGPVDGAELRAGTVPPLSARGVGGDAGLELHVSASPQPLDACGRIGAEVARAAGVPVAGDPELFDFPTSGWFATPGTYYWQVSRAAADGTCTATEARRLILAAATGQRPGVGVLPVLSAERIPRRIGATNGATFVIRTAGIPRGVSKARFLRLVRNSARRWRLHSAGARPGRAVFGNGRSEVGFSNLQAPRQALGVTIFGRRNANGRRERDLILRADIPWEDGPEYPTRRRMDLETVILHELGHMAGNRFHVPRGCSNTPMVVGLATGEWWRSTADFSFRGCDGGG
ncbi:MAG TPA: hypothetical protein VHF51_04935 [Solirubrobacteraceae bacterium]|nr:hypothetical protein [Solirubrobacteraceae bacterium]